MAEQNVALIQAVHDAQQSFWGALMRKDKSLFERILADDFVARSPGQADQTRSAFIATLTSFPMVVLSVGSEDLQVHMFGDVAVVSGVQVARLRLSNGNEVTDTIALTNIFRYDEDQWRMAFSHAVQLPG
jgi:ketosteroid isomerase-like protein